MQKKKESKEKPESTPSQEQEEIKKLKEEMAITPFLEQQLKITIEEGLREIVQRRPDNPVKYLGEFLIKKSEQIK